jgi:hypothetical protein
MANHVFGVGQIFQDLEKSHGALFCITSLHNMNYRISQYFLLVQRVLCLKKFRCISRSGEP